MNLIKSDRKSINILQFAYNYRNKMITNCNQRTIISFQKDLNQINSYSQTKYQTSGNSLKYHNLLVNKIEFIPNLMIIRCLSKGKDKLKEKKKSGKPKVVLTDEEMSELIPINELKIELNKVIQSFKNDLISNINIRSNPQSIDNLVVEIDGSKHCLNEIANITRKSPQLVVVNMSSMPDAIKPVMTAINESGMNLNPQQEGNIIYLPIPKVTREHREGLAHNAKTQFTKTKDQLKQIQSSFSNYIRKQKKSHVSEELIFNVNENLKYLIDNKVHECEQILDQKIKELLN